MTILQSLFLGILQGITEFLPISSSGHLVVTEYLLGIPQDAQAMQSFDVILHMGSLVALLVVYVATWRRILTNHATQGKKSLFSALIIGTIPAAILGVLLEDMIADLFRHPSAVGGAFLITALALYLSEKSHTPKKLPMESLTIGDVLLIGTAQACALIPGISRSGFTISAGRAVGLSRNDALDFSFLLAVPILMGASVMTLLNITAGVVELPSLLSTVVGFVGSFGSSLLVIRLMRQFVVKRSLAWFAWYLVPLGVLLLWL